MVPGPPSYQTVPELSSNVPKEVKVAPNFSVPLGISIVPLVASKEPLASKVPEIDTVPLISVAPLTVIVLLEFTVSVLDEFTVRVAMVFVDASTVTA